MEAYIDELTIDCSTLKFTDSEWIFNLDSFRVQKILQNVVFPGLAKIHFVIRAKDPTLRCSYSQNKKIL